MKHKLYKTHRKRTYYELRRFSTITFSFAILVVAIVVPLTLNVGAMVTPSSSSSPTEITVSSETTSEQPDATTIFEEDVYEDVIPTKRRTI